MKKPWLVAIGTVLFGAYYFAVVRDPLNYQYHFGLYFFAGVCLDLFRRFWDGKPVYLLAAAGAVSLACHLLGADRVALLFLIPVVTIVIGTRSFPVMNKAGRFGDLSYGIYIYAFPVQQAVLWAVGKTLPFVAGLALSAIVTALCAFLSWHLVEHPALRLKPLLSNRFAFPRLSGRFNRR